MAVSDDKAIPTRLGPRPLPQHLTTALVTWLSSRAALSASRSGSLPWRPELAAAAGALREELAAVDPTEFGRALDAEGRRRMGAFLSGVRGYRDHPYGRSLDEPPAVWRSGSARLLDYGATDPSAADGPPLLVVPSLVNRAYVLDLAPRRSLMRHLAGRGLRPLLVDWGAPGPAERDFGLDEYIAGYLDAALDAARRITGRRVALLGYCMGGLLALPLAERRPGDVRGLALLATPWDFHRGLEAQRAWLGALAPQVALFIEAAGELPVDALQAMFAAVDPWSVVGKFQSFATLPARSARARDFVALEDWLNDGVPLAAKVARTCLEGWYVANDPPAGRWTIDGRPVRAERVTVPTVVIVPERDRIVPPASAQAVAEAIPGARLMALPAGHIGMVAGRRAVGQLYGPLARWLGKLPE